MTLTLNPINVAINNRNPMKDFPFELNTMALSRVVVEILCIALADAIVIEHVSSNFNASDQVKGDEVISAESDLNGAFNGVYSECLMHLSYTCLQKKTLLYLKELDRLREISVIGDYVKFVKLNNSENKGNNKEIEDSSVKSSEELSSLIDKAVDHFFNNHLIRFSALGKNVVVPHTVEEFVGRKRKGGGGGGHGGGDGDGGKKKMMMMAMMCMKMKLMMMIPAMMGMMGMMSFKGMMFSMMSFMISKMMLLMKLLEKKGGGGGGGGGGDGSWAGSGGGGAWMPAGGQDYGGGGGYDSNAQWTSRSILEKEEKSKVNVKPVITYIKPVVTYNNPSDMKAFGKLKNLDDVKVKANNKLDELSRRKRDLIKYERPDIIRMTLSLFNGDDNIQADSEVDKSKKEKNEDLINAEHDMRVSPIVNNINDLKLFSILHKINGDVTKTNQFNGPKRKKRGLIDALQNAYIYWTNKVLGLNRYKQKRGNIPKYKIINGVKHMYYPIRQIQKVKTPKALPANVQPVEDTKPIVITDFNKGEIVEEEGRMNRRKMQKINENVNETVDDNPWE